MPSNCVEEAVRAAATSIKQDVVSGQVRSRQTALTAVGHAAGTGAFEFAKCMRQREQASKPPGR